MQVGLLESVLTTFRVVMPNVSNPYTHARLRIPSIIFYSPELRDPVRELGGPSRNMTPAASDPRIVGILATPGKCQGPRLVQKLHGLSERLT